MTETVVTQDMTNDSTLITCERCGRTTTDPDKWDPEADTGRIFCDRCWDHRDEPEHRTRVSIQSGQYVVICDTCNVVGRPETFEGDAEAIAARHQEIGGFER